MDILEIENKNKNMFDENSSNQRTSSASIMFLTLVPLLSSILDLNILSNERSIFNRNASLISIVPLILPFILRNFTELKTSFDYKMCTISSFFVIFKFIVISFVDERYKKFYINFVNDHNSCADVYNYLIGSMIFDFFLASFEDKKLAICYKILKSIGLMVLLIGNKNTHKVISNIFAVYLLFTIPAIFIILNGKKSSKVCTVMCMITFYITLLNVFISMTNENTMSNIGMIVKGISGLVKNFPFVGRLFGD
ncbi:hypothetical protein EDEG_03059 [Edhazardia aedis USNM 41457]|uniref:Uncharacterized protein n=1 Tax=Edhazardia aedis (strain USNM 41457) TaxID=1003232 RepID=J9DMI5_EDHAE|nr:hypothetical protein EDEG_03059 [Edhazardia aedis USNM 41457]|eukprot:EJW02547.1 hypothetical protein EDEG_03059 [Edhazardia aedis USNM 41457]